MPYLEKKSHEEKLKKHHPNCNRDGKNGKTRSKLTNMGGMSTTCLLVTTRLQISSEEYAKNSYLQTLIREFPSLDSPCLIKIIHFPKRYVTLHYNLNHYMGISASNRQNMVRLIFGKNELGAFSESLRPPLFIAVSIMTLAGL